MTSSSCTREPRARAQTADSGFFDFATKDAATKSTGSRRPKSHTLCKRAMARNEAEKQKMAKVGSQRALLRDKLFQQELRAKWAVDYEKDVSIGLAWRRQQATIFNFPQAVPTLGRAALPEWLQDTYRLDVELARDLPPFSHSNLVEFSLLEVERLQRILEMAASISDPELQVPSLEFSRPAFCRFILDSGLVKSDVAGDVSSVPYHQAVRYYDELALAMANLNAGPDNGENTNSLLGHVASLSFSNIIDILVQMISLANDPPSTLKEFFDIGLARLQLIGEALIEKSRLKMRQRMIELSDDSHNASLVSSKHRKECLSIHGAPPRVFEGSVQDWYGGLHFWMATGDDNSLPKAIEKQHNQETALDNYLIDMIMEPGALYVAEACRGIFERIFDIYADEYRLKWDSDGDSNMVKHLSYASFFRFLVDFAVFPQLCSFGFAKQAYRDTDCMEDLGEKPAPEEEKAESVGQPSVSESRSCASGFIKKRRGSVAPVEDMAPIAPPMFRRRNSNNDPMNMAEEAAKATAFAASAASAKAAAKAGATRTQPQASRSKTGVLPPDIGKAISKSSLDPDRIGSPKEDGKLKTGKDLDRYIDKQHGISMMSVNSMMVEPIDLNWIKMSFGSMSDQRLKLYSLLKAIGDCAGDNFNNVVGLIAPVMVGDGDESDLEDRDPDERSQSTEDPDKLPDAERLINASSLLDCLFKLGVHHPWRKADIAALVHTLAPEADGRLRLRDLDKAVARVREDVRQRSQLDYHGFGAPSLNQDGVLGLSGKAALSPIGNLALGDMARQLEHEGEWLDRNEVAKKFAFGPASFVESLFRIAFKHLHSTGIPAHRSMPAGPKAVWLITFLYHTFDHAAALHQAAASGSKSTRSTEASTTRSWTPESPATITSFQGSFPAPNASPMRPPSAGSLPLAVPSAKWASRPKSGSGFRQDKFLGGAVSPSQPAREVLPKDDVIYTPKHVRLIDAHPNLFESLPWLRGGGKRPQSGAAKRPETGSSLCSVCKKATGRDGVGSIHCHGCSGIDRQRLCDSLLWPLMHRSRLRRDRKEIVEFDACRTGTSPRTPTDPFLVDSSSNRRKAERRTASKAKTAQVTDRTLHSSGTGSDGEKVQRSVTQSDSNVTCDDRSRLESEMWVNRVE